jgi:tRNA-dihydrouridine synthase B
MLILGNLHFTKNLIQGPLAGVSNAPFRALTTIHSQPAFSCTEMISCKTILHQTKHQLHRFIAKAPQDRVCFQLSANNPIELGEAVKYITDAGADLIDLNCGCPVNKIRNKGAGSRLLENPTTLFELIRAMKNNTALPVSVKIRIQHDDVLNKAIACAINDAGADFVTVHGRHWTEHYETPVRYDKIAFFVNELNMPVIGNGDIACHGSLQKMLATGCAGVMIGRAGVGQPWIIAKLFAELHNMSFQMPNLPEIGNMYLTHVDGLIALLQNEKFAVIQARKLAKYYARPLKNRAAFCAVINECESRQALAAAIQQWFRNTNQLECRPI